MIRDHIKRYSHVVETVKSVLLGILVLSMITLVAVYIGGTNVYESISAKNNGTMKTFDKLWRVEGAASAEGLDESRLLPAFVGYRQAGGSMICAYANADAASELYGLIKPCLLELFGSDSVCRPLSSTAGEARFQSAIESDEFIYLRYHVPVLYQLIYAYAANKLTVAESDVAPGEGGSISAYVSELIIVPDYESAGHRFLAYAHDTDGNYFEFRPEDHMVASGFYISKLAEAASKIETAEFHFSKDPRLPSTHPIVDAEPEYTVIEASGKELSDEEVLTPLLSLFGYNPDKLNSYIDETGANVYVDSNSRLRVAKDHISFATNDALSDSLRGISIDSLLGYSSDTTLNLFDQITAVDNLIRHLGDISPALIGGEASLCLGSIYSSDSMLVIEYILTYNNIPLVGKPILQAVLTKDTISRVELLPTSVNATEETSHCLRPEFTLRKMTELGYIEENERLSELRMQYEGSDAVLAVIKAND